MKKLFLVSIVLGLFMVIVLSGCGGGGQTISDPIQVTTFAGTVGQSGSTDGTGSDVRFGGPGEITVDVHGNLFITDNGRVIRKITPAGVVSTIAGKMDEAGTADGIGTAARFNGVHGITVDINDNLYVTDNNSVIRKITSSGEVTTIAGMAGSQGSNDGTGSAARFRYPADITIDISGNLYVTDNNCLIRKITPAGVVTTIAGTYGEYASTDGTGTAAHFLGPHGITIDAGGNLYVAEDGSSTIRKITPGLVVTTMAGTAGQNGSTNGTGAEARFHGLKGITVDNNSNVYVCDSINFTIRMITPAGVVSTIAGKAGETGSNDGAGVVARFEFPRGIVVGTDGCLYVTDQSNYTIRKIKLQ